MMLIWPDEFAPDEYDEYCRRMLEKEKKNVPPTAKPQERSSQKMVETPYGTPIPIIR
ncbi:hypothetical protein [Brevibacillus dissolubilis]|uniref:hypothetical protein n=1 Tax=Brevibacillus dissolubilis TaxID=1844116 RepID=UPI00159B9561|nr:hypothetical protein [Brevibacillus dissolubilis]